MNSIDQNNVMVSVLMPVFNGAPYLEASIDSVLAQTFGDWELILLDDGSADNSLTLMKAFERRDRRIRVFSQANQPGSNVARNIDIMCRWARGHYAFYMSQDDTLSPDCLETLVLRAQETGADIVVPDMLLKHADGSLSTWRSSYPPKGDHNLILGPKEAFWLSADFSINGFGLIRMALMADPRNDTRFYDSDEYNSRMQFLWANKVAFAPATFYYYQGNPDAVTRKFSMRRFQRLETGMMLYDSFCGVFPEKQRRLKLMTQLMHFYLDTTVLLYVHHNQMSPNERREALDIFKRFEHHISFAGYRLKIFRRLNTYERFFALCYYVVGTTRHTGWLYRLIHLMRNRR